MSLAANKNLKAYNDVSYFADNQIVFHAQWWHSLFPSFSKEGWPKAGVVTDGKRGKLQRTLNDRRRIINAIL
jgi:hypothetical protein